jgi:hypothetical protein
MILNNDFKQWFKKMIFENHLKKMILKNDFKQWF